MDNRNANDIIFAVIEAVNAAQEECNKIKNPIMRNAGLFALKNFTQKFDEFCPSARSEF